MSLGHGYADRRDIVYIFYSQMTLTLRLLALSSVAELLFFEVATNWSDIALVSCLTMVLLLD